MSAIENATLVVVEETGDGAQARIPVAEVRHTRDDRARWISYGASPRGTIALDRCARAQAWLQGRDYVSPEDIQAVVFDTLRHRILLSFEAEAEGLTSDDVIHELVRRVPVS